MLNEKRTGNSSVEKAEDESQSIDRQSGNEPLAVGKQLAVTFSHDLFLYRSDFGVKLLELVPIIIEGLLFPPAPHVQLAEHSAVENREFKRPALVGSSVSIASLRLVRLVNKSWTASIHIR